VNRRTWVKIAALVCITAAASGLAVRFAVPDAPLPDNVASVLSNLQARVTALETYPPGAMTVLSRTILGSYNTTVNWTSPKVLSVTDTPSWTCQRPTPMMVMPSLTGLAGTGAAGVLYTYVQAVVVSSDAQTSASNDANGQPMANATHEYVNNGGSIFASTPTSISSQPFTFVCPAGTWHATWLVWNLEAGSITFQYYGGQTTVIQLGG
jgi:hypothetical protein